MCVLRLNKYLSWQRNFYSFYYTWKLSLDLRIHINRVIKISKCQWKAFLGKFYSQLAIDLTDIFVCSKVLVFLKHRSFLFISISLKHWRVKTFWRCEVLKSWKFCTSFIGAFDELTFFWNFLYDETSLKLFEAFYKLKMCWSFLWVIDALKLF